MKEDKGVSYYGYYVNQWLLRPYHDWCVGSCRLAGSGNSIKRGLSPPKNGFRNRNIVLTYYRVRHYGGC